MNPKDYSLNYVESIEPEDTDTVSRLVGQTIMSAGTSTSQWTRYSNSHLYSAFHFAELSRKIEERYKQERAVQSEEFRSEIFGRYFRQHRSYVTSAIFSSCAFIEATINELFAETAEHPSGNYAKQMEPNSILLMSRMWKLEIGNQNPCNFIDRKSALEKYQICLGLAEKPLLDAGKSPYQDVRYLIQIRNVLMHYKPQLVVSHATPGTVKVTKKFNDLNFAALESARKFPENSLFEGGNAYFPDRCLGAGCAKWAADSSLQLVQEFLSNLKLIPFMDFLAWREEAITAANILG